MVVIPVQEVVRVGAESAGEFPGDEWIARSSSHEDIQNGRTMCVVVCSTAAGEPQDIPCGQEMQGKAAGGNPAVWMVLFQPRPRP